MARALEMMSGAVAGTADALWSFFTGITWNPLTWDALTWAVAVMLLLLILFLGFSRPRQRPVRSDAKPNVLVSLGEIVEYELEEGDAPLHVVNELSMTVSNMGAHPIQIMELAVITDQMSTPVTAEVAQLVRPNASLRFDTRLDKIVGEVGELELYLYAPKTKKRHFKLTAPFDWEPWNGRYKISPLEQTIKAARSLPSMAARRRQEKEWRERQVAEQARVEAHRRSEQERESVEMFTESVDDVPVEAPRADFPDEF